MKNQFKTATTNGIEIVQGKKFSHYIDGVRYWFFYHDGHTLRVSHLDSGYKMVDVSYSARSACLGDDKAACKLELDNLIKRHGAKKVREIVDNAPKISEKVSA
jgi:hypothetical protein